MTRFLNAKGQPVKVSFFDLFGPTSISRSSKGVPRQERKKPKSEESSPPTDTSPKSTAATEATTEPPTTTESTSTAWTRLEELALLGMKAQNMTWTEIDEALPGKEMEDIKRKYRELYIDAPSSVKPKEGDGKQEEAKKEEEKTDEKKEEAKTDEGKAAREVKSGKEWKRNQKGYKAQKAKVKAEEVKPEEAKPEEANPGESKGILKAKATAEEKGMGGELKSIDGHPVIFVDDDEELEFHELLYLYGLNARYDEQKWISVDSKFFDVYGKRVGPEKLKEKLAGTW